jgi:hypothetical protein
MTGNHWVSLPCIHPADASIHMVGAVHAGLRGAIEFSGGENFINGVSPALLRLRINVDGHVHVLSEQAIAWERESGWIPTFTFLIDEVQFRGVICAPHGRNADLSGAVVEVAVENRSGKAIRVSIGLEGELGHRQLRVQSARVFDDGNRVSRGATNCVLLEGSSAESVLAVAVGSDNGAEITGARGDTRRWLINRENEIAAGESETTSFYISVGQERDGAEAVLNVMRRRGARALIEGTREALRAMEPATGSASADRLVARHMFFAYFGAVARAIDDAHLYVVRSRIPWNGIGLTVRDWEALTWVLPAVQLADQPLARELLLRICDLHGYAPGAGVHYLDGSLFEPGFSLEGAAGFPIAVDEYIVQSGDDKVVEEPLLADSLYNAWEDIEARKHSTVPLYATEVNPDGTSPTFPFTAHGNAVAALALDILSHTLDEKTAERVQDAAAVRAAVVRQFSADDANGKSVLVDSIDLNGSSTAVDSPSPNMYWLPYYDLMARDDSLYRRTVKQLEQQSPHELFTRCARVLGPNGAAALEWLRRAPLDGGVAAQLVDDEGRAEGNGGDAALSGLIAYTAWYAVHAMGVSI